MATCPDAPGGRNTRAKRRYLRGVPCVRWVESGSGTGGYAAPLEDQLLQDERIATKIQDEPEFRKFISH